MRLQIVSVLLATGLTTALFLAPTVAAHEQTFKCGATYEIAVGDGGYLGVDDVTKVEITDVPEDLHSFHLHVVDSTPPADDDIAHHDWAGHGDDSFTIWADGGYAQVTVKIEHCEFH